MSLCFVQIRTLSPNHITALVEDSLQKWHRQTVREESFDKDFDERASQEPKTMELDLK